MSVSLGETIKMKEERLEDRRSFTSPDKIQEREDDDVRAAELVTFDNTTQGLGLKICGGCSTNGTDNFGIFVKRVLPGGLAATSGYVFAGDLILQVNGQSMQGITYDRAVTMLRQASASNHVELVISRDTDAQKEFSAYMNKYGSIQTPSTFKDFVNGGQLTDSDTEFHRKVMATLKDSEVDAYRPGDYLGFWQQVSGKQAGLSEDISASSSFASDVSNHQDGVLGHPVANHLDERNSPSPLVVRPVSDGSNMVNQFREEPLDLLDSMLSRKLSQDPSVRIHIDQLESALVNLGLHVSPTTRMTIRESLNMDENDMVKFKDFVDVTKGIFQNELGMLKGGVSTKIENGNLQKSGPLFDYSSMARERDELRSELATLKEELKNHNHSSQKAEEQLLLIRKQAQASIEEVRSLRCKLHLSEQAQAKAQQTVKDYEEVLTMFENEVAQLRLQLSKSEGVNMQKRLAVLVCQLKKAKSGKKIYEVATEKLLRFLEHSMEVLSSVEALPKATDADPTSAKLNRKRVLLQLSAEGRDVIRTVRSLMETVPLPFGWEEAYTAEGVKYYINHLNQTTTWTHPISCIEHQTSAKSTLPPAPQPQNQAAALAPAGLDKQPQHKSQKMAAAASSASSQKTKVKQSSQVQLAQQNSGGSAGVNDSSSQPLEDQSSELKSAKK